MGLVVQLRGGAVMYWMPEWTGGAVLGGAMLGGVVVGSGSGG